MKRFFKVAILSAIFTFLKMIAGFIVGKVIAIYTGPSGIAMLGQVQSLMNISVGVATSPVGNGLVRYTAENWDGGKGKCKCAPWWSSCIRVAIIILLVFAPLGFIFSKSISLILFDQIHYNWLIQVAVCIEPLSVIGIIISSVINGQQNYRQYILLGMLSVIISTLVVIFFVIYFGLNGALLAIILYTAISGVVMITFCFRESWFKIKYWNLQIKKYHLISVINYTMMALITASAMPLALLIVRKLLINDIGWAGAGYWQAVWKISEVYLGIITIALTNNLLPQLSVIKESVLIKKEINLLSPYIIYLALFAVSIYFLRDVCLSVLFTQDFYSARDLFLYQLVGDVFKVAGFLYAYPMIVQARTKIYISLEIFISSIMVFFSYIFIKYYNVQGANIAYMLTYFIYFVMAFIFTNYININMKKA